MKKSLKRRSGREQRSMQLYSVSPCNTCSACTNCSGTPSWNFNDNSSIKRDGDYLSHVYI